MKRLLLAAMVVALTLVLWAVPASATTDFVACTDMGGNTNDRNMVVAADGLRSTSGSQVRLERLTVIMLCGDGDPFLNSEAFIEFQHGSHPSTWVYAGVCYGIGEGGSFLPCGGYTFGPWGEEKLRREGIWHMKFTDVLIHTHYEMRERGMLCQDADYWVLRNPHGTYRLGPPAFQRCSLA